MKQYKLSYLIGAVLMISGCSSETELQDDTSAALTLHARIEGAQTRATATAFESGDFIGLFVDDNENSATQGANVKYVASGDDGYFMAATGVEPIYFLDTKTVKLSAYYPYTELLSASQRVLSFSTTDQSDPAKWDYLYATTSSNINNKKTEMTFSHVMSKLSFTFVAGEGVANLADDLTDFSLEDLQTEGEFDTSTGLAKAASTSGNPITVDLKEVSVDTDEDSGVQSKTSSVILFPQSSEDEFLLTLTYKEMSFVGTLKLPSGGLEAGVHYTYKLTVSPVGLTVSGYKIQDWNTEVYESTLKTQQRE